MPDPYVYPGTDVLINRLGLRDTAILRQFEIEATAQRLTQGLPELALTFDGYRAIHHHIFQDVYGWAGELRIVDIAKPGALFCRVEYVERELRARMAKVLGSLSRNLTPAQFVAAAAEHLSELNAIHPFREGNGRTMRAFLKVFGEQASHPLFLGHIKPDAWHAASVESLQTAKPALFEQIILSCLVA